ncbi:MAG TPA: hypothetical protein VFQ71_02380 [Gaiellales bacterium]|jgi:hypothetical protein|nr:hypothetical protein [Gaiellales bacterium]
MPERRTASAEVIADRYLTSPARLRERPFGPVDALDTHAGRAAQVRVLFVPGEWSEDELSEAVARWCAIGADGVTGILDHGRHGDRWYLVVPPSLGIPPERWRTMRTPTGAEAGRLTLAFGRLLEAVAASGFPAASAEATDFAVGPGPTTFLEQPLLEPPGTARPIAERSAGQAVLAALFASVCAEADPAEPLQEWRRAAEAGAHPSLGACLDALRAAVEHAPEAAAEPLGLSQIFDGAYVPRRRAPVGLQRLAILLAGLTAALSISLTVLHDTGSSAASPATAAPPTAVKPVVPTTAAEPAAAPAARKTPEAKARHARPHHRHAVRRRPHPVDRQSSSARPPAAAPAPRPAAPPAASPPPTSTPPSSAGASLPAPGGTVLPAP